MIRHFLCVSFLILILGALYSSPTSSNTDARINRCIQQLGSAFSEGSVQDSTRIPLYFEARSRQRELRLSMLDHKSIQELELQSVEFLTEAALSEIDAARTREKTEEIDAQIAALDTRIDSLRLEIDRTRRMNIARLRQTVAEERAGADQIREESERTKELLALQQEESERIRQQLARQRENADRQLNELQSDLIKVSRDARGTIVSMSDLLFDFGKSSLKPELKTSLAKIAGILSVYRQPSVRIEGHTDNIGSERANNRLSQERAQNVMDFLVQQGVEANRLSAVGYGYHRPVASNANEKGRAKNRRVELIIQEPEE